MNQVEHNRVLVYVRPALLDLLRYFIQRDTSFLATAVYRLICQVDAMPALWRWTVLRKEQTYRIDGS
jgi:membrane protein YdbS with pleckstrin-like domain